MATIYKQPTRNFKQKIVFLTQEGLTAAKVELLNLKTRKRAEIATRIAKALEFGSLDENSDYDAALNEQSMAEGRILELEEIIRSTKLIEKEPQDNGLVTLGSVVRIKMDEGIEEFTIVGKLEANPAKKRISNESPIGSALLGARLGDEILVKTPMSSYKCKVLEIK